MLPMSLDQTQHNIKRLTDYFYYYLLSEEETVALLELSILLDPNTLNDSQRILDLYNFMKKRSWLENKYSIPKSSIILS
jgi:hypothetical protein